MEQLTFDVFISGKATLGNWLQLFNGLLTPIVATFGFIIARKQFQIAKLKFNNELFERRMIVFSAIVNATNSAANNERFTNEDYKKYIASIHLAEFWFKNDILELLDAWRKKFEHLKLLQALNTEVKLDPERTKEIENLKSYFYTQLPLLKTYFSSYFAITNT